MWGKGAKKHGNWPAWDSWWKMEKQLRHANEMAEQKAKELNDLKKKYDLTYIFISHDLSVVKFMSDVMCVMQDGLIVEAGAAEQIYSDPREEYTRKLISAIPRDDMDHIKQRQADRIAAAEARS